MTLKFYKFGLVISFAAGIAVGIFLNQLPIVKAYVDAAESQESLVQLQGLLPDPQPCIHRSCYSVGYDSRNRNPAWVHERLTAEGLKGDISRTNCQFKEDDSIPTIFRANLQDYRSSGFDRGHLAPAANHKSSLEEMQETFYLSNMSPQVPSFNRGYWSRVEKYVRDLTSSYPVVHVFTGPLYLPKKGPDGHKWVKYRVIGDNDVSVPTHFFKVLILEKSIGEVTYEGYVLPNKHIDSRVDIESFKTPIEKIEKISGIIFQKLKVEL